MIIYILCIIALRLLLLVSLYLIKTILENYWPLGCLAIDILQFCSFYSSAPFLLKNVLKIRSSLNSKLGKETAKWMGGYQFHLITGIFFFQSYASPCINFGNPVADPNRRNSQKGHWDWFLREPFPAVSNDYVLSSSQNGLILAFARWIFIK